jgi:hypothetical protein
MDAQDWKDWYEERAAMLEFAAGMGRGEAEHAARKEVMRQWGESKAWR